MHVIHCHLSSGILAEDISHVVKTMVSKCGKSSVSPDKWVCFELQTPFRALCPYDQWLLSQGFLPTTNSRIDRIIGKECGRLLIKCFWWCFPCSLWLGVCPIWWTELIVLFTWTYKKGKKNYKVKDKYCWTASWISSISSMGHVSSNSVWENSFQKAEMCIYHFQDPEVATELPLWQLPRKNTASQVCFLYTNWMHVPITHLANRKESQTGLYVCWPKTAPIPLCCDEWPTSKSGSLWIVERGRAGWTGND